MHTNYFLNFKMALYFSALVTKPFNNSRKLAEIINVKLKAIKCVTMHLPTHLYN